MLNKRSVYFVLFACLFLMILPFMYSCSGGGNNIPSSAEPSYLEARVLLNDNPQQKGEVKRLTPLSRVLISIVGTTKSVYTDSSGYAKIFVDPGTYTVTVTKEGYEPFAYSDVVINQSRSTTLGSPTRIETFTSTKPGISNISITSGAAGDEITINGVNWGNSRTAVNGSVSFNSMAVPSYSFTNWGSGQIACHVPVTTTGNIIVTANSQNSPGISFTIENSLWTKTYNDDTVNGSEQALGIAVDSAGYVYVTGFTTVTGQSYNIWTRKYDSRGNIIWTQTYNGTDNGNDISYGIAVDSTGYVYVTGYTTVTGQSANIWIRKYDNDGNIIWTQTYNGTDNGADVSYSIAVDSAGYVCVTGYTTVTGQSRNIWTRKYDSDGNTIWTQTYNGASNGIDVGAGVAVDSSGNVHVTGYETVDGQDHNIWVRKYNASGSTIWTKTYNDTINSTDDGSAITVGSDGYVYVTGWEEVTDESYNIWTRKYDSSGNTIWTKTHNGTGNDWDCGNGMAVDSSGNVYVTGFEVITGSNYNIWTRKYDSSGNTIWTKTHTGTIAGDFNEGKQVAVDSSGNVYVAGYESTTGQSHNIWIRKYDSSGNN